MSARKKICFLIRSLDLGGAETQLSLLARNLNRDRFSVTVVCFYGGGVLAKELIEADIDVISLNKGGRWDTFGFFRRLIKILRWLKPDILHCYLGPSNLFGLGARVFTGSHITIWSIRASFVDLSSYDFSWRLSFTLERIFSRFANLIVANSQAGRQYHIDQGFPASRTIVIENGIDIERYCPSPDIDNSIRDHWDVPAEATLIGLVARLDPMKDHPTFFRAAAILAAENSDLLFVCVGTGVLEYVDEMKAMTASLGLAGKVIWVGTSTDMPAVYRALKIVTSASAFGEGFSNVLGEAMAAGVPCVTTDVGDSANIVGTLGLVVAPGDVEAMAAGWRAHLALEQEEYAKLSIQCRARIVDKFSVSRMIEKSEKAYLNLLTHLVSLSSSAR